MPTELHRATTSRRSGPVSSSSASSWYCGPEGRRPGDLAAVACAVLIVGLGAALGITVTYGVPVTNALVAGLFLLLILHMVSRDIQPQERRLTRPAMSTRKRTSRSAKQGRIAVALDLVRASSAQERTDTHEAASSRPQSGMPSTSRQNRSAARTRHRRARSPVRPASARSTNRCTAEPPPFLFSARPRPSTRTPTRCRRSSPSRDVARSSTRGRARSPRQRPEALDQTLEVVEYEQRRPSLR